MAGGTAHAPGHALPNAGAPAERRAQAWPMWLALASCFRVCQNARGPIAAAAATSERAGARYPLAVAAAG